MTVTELKEYIYDNNKIEFILNAIGCSYIVYHPNNEYYSCSNCNGDNKTAVNVKNNKYLNCRNYTREKEFDRKADLITLVQYNKSLEYKNFSFFDTIKYLHKLLKLPLYFRINKENKKEYEDPLYIFKKIKNTKKKQNIFNFNTLNENILYDFVPYIHIDFYREGIMPLTVKKFGLAYSYKYKRNVIPLRYWLTGELLGFNMRTSVHDFDIFGIKKYLFTKGYPKQINLFGLWENKECIKKNKYVVVYESEKSVLKRDSLNDSTGVAVSGHEISEEQVKILIGLNCEIIIAFDKDISIDYIRYCCEKFYDIRKTSYIYDKWGLLGEKDSPADTKNKIFNFMMKHRTIYDFDEHNKYIKIFRKKVSNE